MLRRVPYSDVLALASTLWNGKPRPDVRTAAQLNVFINKRAREYWERYRWPEWSPFGEQRTFRPEWDANTGYAAAVEVFYTPTQLYYVALRAVPAGTAPTDLGYWAQSVSGDPQEGASTMPDVPTEFDAAAVYAQGARVTYSVTRKTYQVHTAGPAGTLPTDTTMWGEVPTFVRNIEVAQSWAAPIDAIFTVYASDPVQNPYAEKLMFVLTERGYVVRGSAQVVWIHYRQQAPEWTGDIYDSAKIYAADEQAYDPTSGDFYTSLSGSNQGNAVTDAKQWERIEFPRVLKEAVAQGAYADMLGLDGQHDKIAGAAGEALRLLQREFDKLERQQGQKRPLPVRTR